MPFKEYVIIVRGERFVLARDQILFDSPNYFTSLFDGPFKESSEGKREAVLYRDPFLFRLIESYLSGYQILPLPTVGPPQYMSREAMVKNLFADAQFYQLDGLIKLLDPFVNTKYSVFQVFTESHDSSSLLDSVLAITYAWVVSSTCRGVPGITSAISAPSKHTRWLNMQSSPLHVPLCTVFTSIPTIKTLISNGFNNSRVNGLNNPCKY